MPSLREDSLCLAWEEALCAELERRLTMSSLGGGPLCCALPDSLCVKLEKSPCVEPGKKSSFPRPRRGPLSRARE